MTRFHIKRANGGLSAHQAINENSPASTQNNSSPSPIIPPVGPSRSHSSSLVSSDAQQSHSNVLTSSSSTNTPNASSITTYTQPSIKPPTQTKENDKSIVSHKSLSSKLEYPTPSSPSNSPNAFLAFGASNNLVSDSGRYSQQTPSTSSSSAPLTFPTATNPLALTPAAYSQSTSSPSTFGSTLTSFSSLQDQYWSRVNSVGTSQPSSTFLPSTDLEQFSLSNPRYSTPHNSIPFDSHNILSTATTAFSIPAPPLSIPMHQNIPLQNTLQGNPFMFFFAEDPLTSENALDAFQSVSHHHHLNLNSFPYQPPESLLPRTYEVNSETAQRLNDYLSYSSQVVNITPKDYSHYIKAAWLNHEYVNFILHRPSFIANDCDTPLISTLAFLGIYCTSAQHAHLIPLYNNIKGKHALALHETQHLDFKAKLAIMQSCSLLIWRNFVRSSSAVGAHIISDPNYMCIEALISTAGDYLKLGGAFTPQHKTRIYYPNASVDSYQFIFQEASVQDIMDKQWKTWVEHESCIRVLHFLMFTSKERVAITKRGHVFRFMDFDVPMSSPDSLWQASSTEMFFHTVGPTRTIRTLSYVHILKSMLRMPSLTEYGTKSVKLSGTSDRTTWTIGPYVIVLYGLATVAWGVGGGSPELFDAVHESFDKDYNPRTSIFRRSLDANGNFVADRGLQSRVYYAFEMLEVLCERTTRKFEEADFTPYLNALNGHSNDGGPPGTRNALTHIALERDSPPPWLCTVAGCLHFQLCYFSLYRDTPYVNDLISALPQRLSRVKEVLKAKGMKAAEDYLLFGEGADVEENYNQYYKWVHHDRTENCIAITTYYMINLVAAKNSVAFGGLEASVMRELLYHSLIFLWTWDYAMRERTQKSFQYAKIPPYLLEFWMSCESLAPVPAPKRHLIEQSLGFLLGIWKQTRKSFIDPTEKFARRYKPFSSFSVGGDDDDGNLGHSTSATSGQFSNGGLSSGDNSYSDNPLTVPSNFRNSFDQNQIQQHQSWNQDHSQNTSQLQHQRCRQSSVYVMCGASSCMEIFLYLDSALRLDSSELLNNTLCDLTEFLTIGR